MRRLSIIRRGAGAVIAVLVASCSSSGTLTMKASTPQAIRPGSTLSLSVEATTTVSEASEVASRLRDRLFGKLVSEGIFRSVVRAPEPADYRMDVKLTGAREVSGGARFWLGAMAGPNTVEASVELREATSNQVLKAFDVVGHSASHPLSSEAGLDDAVREAVDEIVKGLT